MKLSRSSGKRLFFANSSNAERGTCQTAKVQVSVDSCKCMHVNQNLCVYVNVDSYEWVYV